MSVTGLCHSHGMMECWISGIMRIKIGKSVTFGSGALRLRITSLRHKAKYSWLSASSPPQADAPPTSIRVIPIHEPIIPVFHYSSWDVPAGAKPPESPMITRLQKILPTE